MRIEATVGGKTRFGSGFVVRNEGDGAYIATAAHVVEGDPNPRVYFRSQPHLARTAKVIAQEGGEPNGLAVLLVASGAPADARALPMAEGGGTDLSEKQAVTALGIPASIRNWAALSGTVISFKNRNILFSGGADDGNSGGPLVAGSAVVGLVMRATRFGEAVPAVSLRIFLKNNHVAWGSMSGSKPSEQRGTGVTRVASQPALAKLTVRSNVRDDLVFIDGKRYGPTQLDVELPPGFHVVRVEKEGHEPWEKTVELGAGEEKMLWTRLQPPGPKPLETVRDCAACPEMVVIPAGSFQMGSPAGEQGHGDDEGPVHRVTFDRPFAIAAHEVTFDQWDACVRGGGCRHQPEDAGWGRGRRPVNKVSWKDAREYVVWLSKQTGQPYRLPSEAEWEYAARAGTRTPFFTGDCISTDQANYDGNYDYADCGAKTGVNRGKTLPVGSLASNTWGLFDMLGNVSEWTEDCYNDSYNGAPSDGSAWTRGNCGRRVLRGGSWISNPDFVRSANRNWDGSEFRGSIVGFRPARTL